MEEHTTFCPACGAPQIKVIAPGNAPTDPPNPPSQPDTPDFIQPPAIHVSGEPAGQIQWKKFWRVALPLALISGVAMGYSGLIGAALFLASLIIAVARYRRDHAGNLTASQGGKLGAVMGLLASVAFTGIFVIQVVMDFAGIRQQYLQNLQKLGGNPDPQVQKLVHWAGTNQGFVVLSVISMFITVVLVVVVSGVVGAVTASLSGKRR